MDENGQQKLEVCAPVISCHYVLLPSTLGVSTWLCDAKEAGSFVEKRL